LALVLGLCAFQPVGDVRAAIEYTREVEGALVGAPSRVYDGFKGNMEIRTNPATIFDHSYVHFAQVIIGGLGEEFLGIGTYNGLGAKGDLHDCADDYDPNWSGYYDYMVGGLYACYSFSPDQWVTGSNPTFRIEYTLCPNGGYPSWVLYFAGTMRTCMHMAYNAGQDLGIALETVTPGTPANPTDRNIDVKFTALMRNQTNGTNWINLGLAGNPVGSDFYDHTEVSSTAWNFYLAPLN
jgi:hypothetical protein